ncbi:MAG: ABC transporter substrate-binding protein [Thermoprotei archaeon]|nr:ABC transporter substrate-binding protein [Thermoprotei archaeon]
MSVDRRGFIKTLGAGVVGLAVGAVLGWAAKPLEVREVTKTETVTVPGVVERKLPKATVKIGVLGIRSGLWSTYGEFIEQGARLAAEEINAKGGILGSRVELVFRDELADVVKQAKELVDVEGADFIIGIDSSGNAMKVGGIVSELGKILVVTHAATHRLTEELVYKEGKKLIFRSSVPVYQDGTLAAYIAKDLPVRKWAGINGDYEFGRVSWELFTKTLKALRPDVEFVVDQWPKFGTEDFTPFISALLASDAEALFTSIWAIELVTLQRQLTIMGGYKKFRAVISTLGYSMDVAYSLGTDYPTAELGTWVSARYMWPYPPTKANKDFVDRFKARWGRLPAYSAETTYSAIYMLKAALENAATLDPDILIKTLEGLVIMTPAGVRWIRPEDHQAIYEVPYGRIVHKGAEVPLLEDLKAVPAMLYYRHPPFT